MVNIIYIGVIALLVGVDHLIKWWAVEVLAKTSTIPLINDVLHLTYVENFGAAFGMLQQKKLFLVVFTAIILAIILYFLLAKIITAKPTIIAGLLIVAGGMGNLIDRIFRGFVIDYIDFRLINFAVFNFADSCVVIGTGIFLIYMLFFENKKVVSDNV